MAHKRRKLGDILKRWGVVNDQQIEEALQLATSTRKRVGEALVELGHATENDVAKALASQYDMEFVDLDQPDAIDRSNLELIPQDLMKKYLVLPLAKEGNKVKVLCHDPMDLALLDDLRFRLGSEIELALGSRSRIKDYLANVFSETRASIDQLTRDLSVDHSIDRSIDSSLDSTIDASMDRGQSLDLDGDDADGSKVAERAPIVRLVKQIIEEAVITRASDIHIEPFEDRVRLRYRIDGVCHERDRIPKRTQSSVIARIKLISGMKIEERRIPQDGRIKMRVHGDSVDFRVSALPARHGESIVMRILRPEAAKVGLANLGMHADTLDTFHRLIRRPNGILLVTGPTGSGKTTTLYSALDELNRPDRKIITAEDPIEYNFKGINQCQVNEQIGLGFAEILRSMLRQAPEIILVGEIRDRAVGEVAVQAALTGHLVFSTLHTNDAPSAVTRLIDMGLKPFLVASSIQAVLAQRLVRKLCENCKEPDPAPERRVLQLCGLKSSDIEGQTLYKPVGCNRCSKTGYRGRIGIYELMVMNHELRELAFKSASLSQLRKAARAAGMRDLLGDGRLKAIEGITTLQEVSRLAQVGGVVEEEEEIVTV